MTAVLSRRSSPSPPTAPESARHESAPPSHTMLPPLNTNPPPRRPSPSPVRQSPTPRARMSTFSSLSGPLYDLSRPGSHVFPAFHSSLPYALVRDFAYPSIHPLHYGPQPEELSSGQSTPIDEPYRRLSDPAPSSWDDAKGNWSTGSWGDESYPGSEQLPATSFHDGPPWSEDEDLHSPVVVSSRHRKQKSSTDHGGPRGEGHFDDDVYGLYAGTHKDGSETYYVREADEAAGGPGGEFITYPPEQSYDSSSHRMSTKRDSHFAALLPNRSYSHPDQLDDDISESDESPFMYRDDDSRYSKDYQFTIASPDEEMHGKAVALFDFTRENDNELPLVEGQVILVSYRHGQGWLVAEDPRSGESGLVPEEYVRLLRDIEGGWSSLNGDFDMEGDAMSPMDPEPQSTSPPPQKEQHIRGHVGNDGSSYQHPPTVSTFSTSSKDFNPYPPHLLGTQSGQTPPLIDRNGSHHTPAGSISAEDSGSSLDDAMNEMNFSQSPPDESGAETPTETKH